jgi:hypothetical protein
MKTIAEQLNIKYFPFEIKNKKGDVLYREELNHTWVKKEYDDRGNQTYHENYMGYWAKREYDERGNLIYYKNSNRYWVKTEYDEMNNQIYYEDSNGKIRDYRPKLDKKLIKSIMNFAIKDITGKTLRDKTLEGMVEDYENYCTTTKH